jgi:hypothetical protein
MQTQQGGTANEGLERSDDERPENETKKVIRGKVKIWKLLFPLALVVPYLVGALWHIALHPTASVFTGDFSEARRWYIDENSLDPGNFRMNKRYNIVPMVAREGRSSGGGDVESMCWAVLRHVGVEESGSVSCQDSAGGERLQLVSIVPSNAAVSPSQEAIVIVVPFSDEWRNSQFHYSILQLIKRLSSPDFSSTPWMGSKTVVFVSPLRNVTSLYDTVQTFLRLESTSRYMIRNLLVLDFLRAPTDATAIGAATTELRILPQGRHGVLPNMDLVFLMYRIFSQISAQHLLLTIHPHTHSQHRVTSTGWWRWLFQNADQKWQSRLLNLLFFEYTLTIGGYSASPLMEAGPLLPHSPALDDGIDALTLQLVHAPSLGANTRSNSNNVVVADVVSKMEPVLRALCNLHERLHHSTRLYLLVSPDRFVKHEEYLVPNLLLLVPLIVRAVTLALFDIHRFDLYAIGRAIKLVVGSVVALSYTCYALEWLESRGIVWPVSSTFPRHVSVLVVTYMPLLVFLMGERRRSQSKEEPDERRLSIQFAACLLALYLHVAITFGHVSLSFPSALLWTPLIAFPSRGSAQENRNFLASVGGWMVVVATCPYLPVPAAFPTYTLYVRYLYIPLHLFVALLWL